MARQKKKIKPKRKLFWFETVSQSLNLAFKRHRWYSFSHKLWFCHSQEISSLRLSFIASPWKTPYKMDETAVKCPFKVQPNQKIPFRVNPGYLSLNKASKNSSMIGYNKLFASVGRGMKYNSKICDRINWVAKRRLTNGTYIRNALFLEIAVTKVLM